MKNFLSTFRKDWSFLVAVTLGCLAVVGLAHAGILDAPASSGVLLGMAGIGQTITPQVIDPSGLAKYGVNVVGNIEAIGNSLYDDNTYAQAGQAKLQFFLVPIGGGATPKTLGNTNMDVSGMLPAGKAFLVQGVELAFYPTAAISAVGALTTDAFLNDVYSFGTQQAWLDFFVGSKSYLQDGPLAKFPPFNGISGFASQSDTTTAAASRLSITAYGTWAGHVYMMASPVLLTPNQNFNVSLNFNTVTAISATARVVCTLRGTLYRLSQ